MIPNEGDAPLDGEQSELDSVDLTIILDGFRLRGVKSGCGVTTAAGMTATVAAGVISFDTGVSIAVAGGTVAFAAAGSNTRFDLVVVDSSGALSVIDGGAFFTPTFGPTFPTYTDRVVLAVVEIQPTTTSIGAANIIDKRVLINIPTSSSYTDEQAQDAVGGILTDTASIDFTYNDAGNTISAVVLPAGVDHNSLANLTVADAHTQYTRKDTLTTTGDLYYASAPSTPARLGVVIPAANVRNVLGLDNGDTIPAWKVALDATAPTASALADAATSGTSLIFAHRDHLHGRESFASPTIVLGTVAGAGAATTPLRSDATIVAFDVTVPTTIAAGDAAAAGIIAFASRRDHRHGSPSTWPATSHAILDSTFHSDTLTGSVLDGDVIIGNVTPKWSRLDISVPAANVLNVLAVANGETRPSWKSILDGTNPADIANAATPGTSLISAHRDHVHNFPNLAVATYLRLGSTSAPTNIVSGDLTVERLKVVDGAFGTGVEFSVTGDGALSGFLRVGSETAPANTTAGDLTSVRLNIGNNTAFSVGDVIRVEPGTRALSNNEATIRVVDNFTHSTLNHDVINIATTGTRTGDGGANLTLFNGSLTDAGAFNVGSIRVMSIAGIFTQAAAGKTLTEIAGIYLSMSVSGNKTITNYAGLRVKLSSSGGVSSTIGTVRGLWLHADAAATATVTDWNWIDITDVPNTNTVTNYRGINIPNLGSAGVTTAVGIDIAAQSGAVTANFGIRNAGNSVQTGYARFGAVVAPANTTAGDLTSVRLLIGVDSAFAVGDQLVVTKGSFDPAGVGQTASKFSVTYAPSGAGSGLIQVVLAKASVVPTAADTGFVLRTLKAVTGHDGGVFNLGTLIGITSELNKTVGGTVTTCIGILSETSTYTAGTTTTLDFFRANSQGLGATTVTTLNHYNITADGTGTVGTNRGLNVPNLGSATVTNAIGIDLAAQSGAVTLNFAIRNAGNSVQTGYARFGAVTAPTNISSGDLTSVRMKVGDGAFGSGVEFSVTGDGALSGFLRVGSETAPTNVTAGDLTSTRALIGTDVAMPAGVAFYVPTNAARFAGTVSETAISADRVDIGTAGGTPRIIFEDGANATIWEIDSSTGFLRIFNPGTVRAQYEVNGGQILGYFRVGSTATPTNVTAGDLTCIRLNIGNVAFGAGAEAQVSGDGIISGFLRVGNAAAPTNTTAGDFTAIRAVLGTDAAMPASTSIYLNAATRVNGSIGFFNATPAVQQTSGANLTNNVTAGGTDDTIANITDQVVYANDAANIRNDIYQLARKLKQINDGLRTLGLFT